jgi:hypothetical protein
MKQHVGINPYGLVQCIAGGSVDFLSRFFSLAQRVTNQTRAITVMGSQLHQILFSTFFVASYLEKLCDMKISDIDKYI